MPREILNSVEKFSRMLQRGSMTLVEFVNQLPDCFAVSPHPDGETAVALANLIPDDATELVLKQVNTALAPGYLRRPFAIGGPGPGEAKLRQMTIEATECERAWAVLIKPILESRQNA